MPTDRGDCITVDTPTGSGLPPATPAPDSTPYPYHPLPNFTKKIDESVPSGRFPHIITNFPNSPYGGPLVRTWCDRCGREIAVPSLHPGPYVCVVCLESK